MHGCSNCGSIEHTAKSCDCCYNCGSKQLLSKFCDKPQRMTRCTVCNVVCKTEEAHLYWCTNKSFVSQLNSSVSTVLPMTSVQFGFHGISKVFIADGDCYVPINENPLYVANVYAFVYKESKQLLYAMAKRNGESAQVNFVNSDGQVSCIWKFPKMHLW